MLELPLRDFCIGHRLILLKQRNPLLWASETEFNHFAFEQQTAWLIEAVYTCAQSYAYRARLEKSPTRWLLWRNDCRVNKWHRLRRAAQQKWQTDTASMTLTGYWSAEIARFRNYLNASRIVTQVDEKREGFPFMPIAPAQNASADRSLGGPYEATLIQFLIKIFRKTEAEALEYPLALAQAHFLTHLEREGALKILNAEELDFKEYCADHDLQEARAAGFKTVAEHVAHVLAEDEKRRAAEKAAAEQTPNS